MSDFKDSGPGPRHVGIIMDGNGRWAARRGKPRIVGHRVGATAVRRVVEAAARAGLEQLTLFAFSTENWQRPPAEVGFLMRLLRRALRAARRRLVAEGIRVRAIGRLDELPLDVRRELQLVLDETRGGTRMTLCLAINYGGRRELVDACRRLAQEARDGRLSPEDIDEAAVEARLYQPDMPPLDLVVRTAGEMRLSNFLLWQAAYAEFWTTSVCWPEFTEAHLLEALAAFRRRERRFGALPPRSQGGRPDTAHIVGPGVSRAIA